MSWGGLLGGVGGFLLGGPAGAAAGYGIGNSLGGRGRGGGGGDGGMSSQQLAQMRQAQQQNLGPYVAAGQAALPRLSGEYQGIIDQANPLGQYQVMVNDPGALMSRLGSGYQQSPGYQYNVDQATRASNNAAAAGGFIGSPQHQLQMAKEIGGLANQDYGQYLNNAMGLYGQGVQGIGNMYGQGLQGMQNMAGMGLDAGRASSATLSDMLKSQAQLSYSNYWNNRKSLEGGLGNLLGGRAGSFGSLGGSGFFGGTQAPAPVVGSKPIMNPNWVA